MTDVICRRHNAIALTTDDLGSPLCSGCFQEALYPPGGRRS